MFKKFLSLFTWWKLGDRGITQKPKSLGFNHNPRPAEPWPDLAGSNRRIQPERIAPFGTGTPHDRMHDLIVAGKPDALIAIELGVDISAVRNYRHIISARGREAARRAAGSRLPPRVLDTAWMNRERSDHRGWQRRDAAERVPAALLRRAEKLDETARINETYGKFYDPDLSQAITSQGCALVSTMLVSTMLDELARIESQCPASSSDISSGGGGDFGGAGATGSFSND